MTNIQTAHAQTKLIVTADDFGADVAVNDAIIRGHRDGILTAASLMVAAPAAADAVLRAKAYPKLGVGLHLVLVEGRPTLPPKLVPDLVGPDGYFRTDMAWQGARMFFLPHVRKQLAAEITAQFEAFAATGLALDHVNAHKHYHLHPTIAALTLKIGTSYGLKAMRVPYEPAEVIHRVEPDAPHSALVAWYAQKLKRTLARDGVRTTDATFGLSWSGAMTTERVCGLLKALPPGLNEIYFHPAMVDSYPQSAPGYRYREEANALTAPEVLALVRQAGMALGPFAAFG
ncbi:MAG: hopanoid biosynthesis-associated protein HpnK [Rhizomicrobium sp.]